MHTYKHGVTSASMTFLSFAMPASMLGVMWPEVRVRFGQTLGTLGFVTLVYGLARTLTCASGRRMIATMGTGASFVTTLALLAASSAVLGGAPTWPIFLAAVAGIGLTSGMLDSIGAVFITRLGDVSSAGLIHGCYGVGATIGPLIIAVVPTWRVGLFVSAAITLATLGLAYRTRHLWPPDSAQRAAQTDEGRVNRRAVLLSVGMFISLVGIEVSTGQWAHTYLTDHRGVSSRVAAIGVAGFWGGITVGRLGLSRPTVTRAIRRVGLPGLATIAATLLVGVVVVPPIAATVLLAAVGIAISPIVPTLFATTADRVGVAHAQRVAGWQLLAANTGAIAAPSITGTLVDRIGPGTIAVVWFAVIAAGIPLLLAAQPLHRMARPSSEPSEGPIPG